MRTKKTIKALTIVRQEDGSYQMYALDLPEDTKKTPLDRPSTIEVMFGRLRQYAYTFWHPGGQK